MPKDPSKWKGRAVVDEDAVAERQKAKEQAAMMKKIAANAKQLRNFKIRRIRENEAKAREKDFARRLQQLGVLRAMVSGVTSMQLKVTFAKWLEFIQVMREERMEAYRRYRWQLSCPHHTSDGRIQRMPGCATVVSKDPTLPSHFELVPHHFMLRGIHVQNERNEKAERERQILGDTEFWQGRALEAQSSFYQNGNGTFVLWRFDERT